MNQELLVRMDNIVNFARQQPPKYQIGQVIMIDVRASVKDTYYCFGHRVPFWISAIDCKKIANSNMEYWYKISTVDLPRSANDDDLLVTHFDVYTEMLESSITDLLQIMIDEKEKI